MTRFAVIGSNCFTGSHIVDRLIDNPENSVVGISQSAEYKSLYLPYRSKTVRNFRFERADLVHQGVRLLGLLGEFKPDVVVNVAALSEVALSNERPVEYFETNTTGVVKLCHHLRHQKYLQHYVHISSAEVYGSCDFAVKEEQLFNPSTPYAVSKAAADMFINSLIRRFGFPATLIRSTNVYGKHQQLFKIIPRAIIYLKLGKTLELHGGGASMKSFVHVRDVVDGLMKTVEQRALGTWHFSVPSEHSVADIVRLVCEAMGQDFASATQSVGERLGQDSRYWLDCTKSRRELGWTPRRVIQDGIRETVQWIEENWETVKSEPLNYIHKWAGAN